jgi:hypothetical protein
MPAPLTGARAQALDESGRDTTKSRASEPYNQIRRVKQLEAECAVREVDFWNAVLLPEPAAEVLAKRDEALRRLGLAHLALLAKDNWGAGE